ncbi:MAG TPA: M56 family metallopeptidase [Candidatus Acidoferrum sp.]|nr:M56 family metallopeptidase [Candidatus Acidoferrum sp.]
MNPLLHTISNGLLHSTVPALVLDAWLKSLVVLALAATLCWSLRRAAAAARHWVWLVAMASLPCLLVLAAVPRPWQRPIWSVSADITSGNQVALALTRASGGEQNLRPLPIQPATPHDGNGSARVEGSRRFAARFSADWAVLAGAVWFAGAALGLATIALAQVRLFRLVRAVSPLDDPRWNSLLTEACERLGLRRPVRLLQSSGSSMPLTWGWRRPVVLLPAEAAQWPAERCRVVLLHELAHIKRRDCLTQALVRVVCALYWPNPLVWLAARRMCIEREQACDDLVLHSGCRASDYASHLLDIARSFRRAPALAGIAIARSPRIRHRIAAIIDPARARQLRPATALALLVLMLALALIVGESCSRAPRSPADTSPLRQQQVAEIKSFAQSKEKQSRELASKADESIPKELEPLFQAATQGDWQKFTNLYRVCRQGATGPGVRSNAPNKYCSAPYWQPLLELELAYDTLAGCEPKYTQILADGIINSIPPGSIYFGGTDPGRGIPTAFSKSQVDGDPFFTLTQNALTDSNYLAYVRSMYGGKIHTPTDEDSKQCYDEYLADAQRRLAEHKLMPGEDLKTVAGKTTVQGQVGVMMINGLLSKLTFDRNPEREFYVEESFPLDWMYPHLEPHGLIMKINRESLTQLPEDTLAKDHDYWSKLVGDMLGDGVKDKTTVRELADFIERVYVRHDLKGFTGDPLFIQNSYAQHTFSKLRSSIGGLYAWRLTNPSAADFRPKTPAEYERVANEADFAFRQAWALCPTSPEAVFRYVQLLIQQHRMDDAIMVAETCAKADPSNNQVQGLISSLKQYRKQLEGKSPHA